jgi:hypothetical protein
MKLYTKQKQEVFAYAQTPAIRRPDGTRKYVENPDLWMASKINSTLKKGFASDVYNEKIIQEPEKQIKFIEGVRNHSWNRQHMGAMVVGGVDVELSVSSLVSNAITLGKFYKIQQQTRRSVILDEFVDNEYLNDNDEVASLLEKSFTWYREITNPREGQIKGFDRYVQDAFKILPIGTMTKVIGNWDLRVVKGYARWREIDYLPSDVRDFGMKLNNAVEAEYPIFYKSYLVEERETASDDQIMLQMTEKIGSNDLLFEPMLWYSDHSFLIPENQYFNSFADKIGFKQKLAGNSPSSLYISYFNPLGYTMEEMLELFKSKDESNKSVTEMLSFMFVSKIDLSGAIDTWRHTRNNRIVQSIYDAADDGQIGMPELFRRQKSSNPDSTKPDEFMTISSEQVEIYHSLLKQGIPKEEAINVLPHSLMVYQIEMMDLFSFLNLMGLRTCTHARPDVQVWAKALLKNASEADMFKEIDMILGENNLAYALQRGYCSELGNCRVCGKDVIYLPDPFRG